MTLRKGIPVAGGMAGGSADAAGTLVALSSLWRLELGRDDLSELAAELGSDVTFGLHGGTALGTGRGEKIIPVLARHRLHWVIALARGGLSTPRCSPSWTGCVATARSPSGRSSPSWRHCPRATRAGSR